MKIKVEVIQKRKYTDKLIAEFETWEEVTAFCNTVLKVCENVYITIEVSNVPESESEEE